MSSFIYFLITIFSVSEFVLCQDSILEEFNIASYRKCKYDRDCLVMSNNSFCSGYDVGGIGYCKCKEGFNMIDRNKSFFSCLKSSGYGKSCDEDMQCQLNLTEHAECFHSVCRCKEGAHLFTDGRCYKSVLLGDICLSDGDCWMTGDTFGNCVFGKCTCKYDGEVPNEDKLGCVVGRKLGEFCNNDAECGLIPNADCRVNCRCAAGFVLSRDQTKCLRAATQFSDSCEENDQCSAFLRDSICSLNNCSCDEGYHTWSTRCVRSSTVGSPCSNIEECISNPKYSDTITCLDGICQCLKGAVNETLGCNNGVVFKVSVIALISFIFCTIL